MNSPIFKVFAQSLIDLIHDLWKNYFRKPKLLLAASRLDYLNVSVGVLTFHSL